MDNANNAWPHRLPVAIDPAQRKGLLIFAVIAAVWLLNLAKGDDIAQYFADSHDRGLLEPKMAQLATQGKAEAVVWMYKHGDRSFYKNDEASSFPALHAAAETGHPESLYLYAQALRYIHDDAGCKLYLDRAADAGFPAALLVKSEESLCEAKE